MSIFRKLYNFTHPLVGEIWCLHRVLPERSMFKSNRDLEITPAYLEKLIQDKRSQGFRFVDMDTIVAVANGKQKGRRLAHVTFDDGFADVFANAYPILKKHQIPFTLYVTTDMPDGKADLWWYQLETMVKGNAEWFEKVVGQVYARKEDVAATMHEMTSSACDPTLCQKLSLSWEQIREMVSEGLCTVGSHGVSHSALSLLSEEAIKHELVDSKQRLEAMLGVEVKHFSYPHSFYTETTPEMVRAAGYNTMVIGYGGSVHRKKGNDFFYRKFIVQP